jgi:hypothetical protein
MMAENGAVLGFLRRYLGLEGAVFAFTVVDSIGLLTVMELAGQAWLGYLGSAAAIAISIFGFRAGTSARLRLGTLVALVLLLFLLPQAVLIAEQPPNAAVHDGVLMTDAAADRLLHGQDPYGHDYIDSRARTFYLSDVPVNFGLKHYVYMPGMILLDLPIRAIGGDHANFTWMFLPGLLALLAAAYNAGLTSAEKLAAAVAITLNPVFQLDFLYFLNELFFLAPALAAVGMLRRDRPVLAGLFFGLSLCIKQQAILFLPLLLAYAWWHWDRRRLALAAAGTLAPVVVLVTPFLVWNPNAFLADTAAFFYGSGVDSYPIRGLGLPGLMLRFGVLGNRWEPLALAPEQLLAVALVLLFAGRRLRLHWSWPAAWAWLGLLVLGVFFFGRVLAPNYLDLALMLFSLALLSRLVDEGPGPVPVAPVDAGASKRRVRAVRS